jgi:hypothetical protein
MQSEPLLDRDTFRQLVFERDNYACVACGASAAEGVRLDAHHIIERRLFTAEGEEGGYFVDNGATLCDDRQKHLGCHRLAEQTVLSPSQIRELAGIKTIVLPNGTYDGKYTKWLDPILKNERRGRGPLFYDLSVQRILAEAGMLHRYTMYVHYPRTWHLPDSPRRTKDDCAHHIIPFANQKVIASIKRDGENATIYADGYVHARSIDAPSHLSQTWIRNLAARLSYQLDPGFRLCGENLYARHAIQYDDLESYFDLFSVWDNNNISLSWSDVELWAQILDIPTVPILYRGPWNHNAIVSAFKAYQEQHGEQEGWVVRTADAFAYQNFKKNVAKWVRPHHNRTTVHNWREWFNSPDSTNHLRRIE